MPKFRVWDKKRGMYDVSWINFDDNEIGVKREMDGYIGKGKFKLSEVVLMQSTGLFNKNGKEIFEGDVVRYTWDMPSDVNATKKGKKVRISKVFWSDWRASWAIGKKCCNNDLFRYARNGNTVEIIGNIYQNQELLEEVK